MFGIGLEDWGILIGDIVAPLLAVVALWFTFLQFRVGVKQWNWTKSIELEQEIVASLSRKLEVLEGVTPTMKNMERDASIADFEKVIEVFSSDLSLPVNELRYYAKQARMYELHALRMRARKLSKEE